MISHIKRQQDLRRFIQDQYNDASSLRQLLCSFLLNCTEEVRAKCYQLLSANNPVPAITERGDQFFTIVSYWITSAVDEILRDSRLSTSTTRILSCGLEDTCKGKSTLLNAIFCTSFEENEYDYDRRFFHGTVDMQLVRNFGLAGNNLRIADTHGVVGDVLLEKMAGAFDAIIVHLGEKLCDLDKHIEFIRKLASRVHKRLFVFVRDSKIDNHYDCCNQTAMTHAFGKLAALVKGKSRRQIVELYSATDRQKIDAVSSVVKPLIERVVQEICKIRISRNTLFAVYPAYKEYNKIKNELSRKAFYHKKSDRV